MIQAMPTMTDVARPSDFREARRLPHSAAVAAVRFLARRTRPGESDGAHAAGLRDDDRQTVDLATRAGERVTPQSTRPSRLARHRLARRLTRGCAAP